MLSKKDLVLNKEQQILFEEHLKYSYKLADIFAKKYNMDKDECISICLENLARAIKEYRPKNKNSKITGWISLVTENRIKSAIKKNAHIINNEVSIEKYLADSFNMDAVNEIRQEKDFLNEECLDVSIHFNEIMDILEEVLKKFTETEGQIYKEVSFNSRTLMEVGSMYGISHTSVAKIVKSIRESFFKSYYI